MYEDRKEEWKRERFEYLMNRKKDIEKQIADLVEYPYCDIQAHLRDTKLSIDQDLKIFNEYDLGDMDLKECIRSFMYNNGITEKKRTFEDHEFEGWLRSQGYGQ